MSAKKVKSSVRSKGIYEAVDAEKGEVEDRDRKQNANEGTESQRKSCCARYASLCYPFSECYFAH